MVVDCGIWVVDLVFILWIVDFVVVPAGEETEVLVGIKYDGNLLEH